MHRHPPGIARFGDVLLERVAEHPGDEPLVAAAEVGARRDVHPPCLDRALPRHRARTEEQLRDRTVRDRGPGLGHPGQLGVLAVHRVREDGAPAEQARAADRRAGQEFAVVGVEVRVDLVDLFGRVDLAGPGRLFSLRWVCT